MERSGWSVTAAAPITHQMQSRRNCMIDKTNPVQYHGENVSPIGDLDRGITKSWHRELSQSSKKEVVVPVHEDSALFSVPY